MDNKLDAQPQMVSWASLLERGLVVLRKITEKEIPMTRSEAVDMLNFEVVVQQLIKGMKQLDGKSLDELLEMRKAVESPPSSETT
jgi:hypothetical protein